MDIYWFRSWTKSHDVTDEASLQRVLGQSSGIDSLLNSAPELHTQAPIICRGTTDLTAGKGIDLSGELGCHHIDCLRKEIDGLFRHVWHYFDRIILPDVALTRIFQFHRHK